MINDIPNKYTSFLDEVRAFCGDLSGKYVLDVGADEQGHVVAGLCDREGAARAVGVGLEELLDSSKHTLPTLPTNASLLYGDAGQLHFGDESFDAVVSLAAFEHFHNLTEVIEELYRVLKPGGVLYSNFGPVWSSPIGHHLWMYIEGEEYSYRNLSLPPYCHLLMSPQDLVKMLTDEYDAHIVDTVVDYIFTSSEQNRLFFDEYAQLLAESRFEVLFFMGNGISHRIVTAEGSEYPQALKRLHDQYGRRGFEYNCITTLLRKPG